MDDGFSRSPQFPQGDKLSLHPGKATKETKLRTYRKQSIAMEGTEGSEAENLLITKDNFIQ